MQDTYGLLPPAIAHNYEREEMVDKQLRAAATLYNALRSLDPRLDLVFIGDRADPEYGVVPGRWHVKRRNDPPAPDSYIPITTPDGGYREPDSRVFVELQQRDMWTRGTEAVPKEQKPQHGPTQEQIRDEVAADIKTAWRLPGENMTKRRWGR